MVKIVVIDNGGQWTHREWRVLREIGVESEIIKNDTPLENIKADGIVLSGGTANFSYEEKVLGRVDEYLAKASVPILGICLGHQFMAIYYGGKVQKSKTPEFGKVEITVGQSLLYDSLPRHFVAWESHNDEVVSLPKNFRATGFSNTCPIESMEDEKQQRFGVQFHPEVEHTQYGREIFKNFIKICKK